jgi:hypothetical protein
MHYIFLAFRWYSYQRRGEKILDHFKAFKVLIHWKHVRGVCFNRLPADQRSCQIGLLDAKFLQRNLHHNSMASGNFDYHGTKWSVFKNINITALINRQHFGRILAVRSEHKSCIIKDTQRAIYLNTYFFGSSLIHCLVLILYCSLIYTPNTLRSLRPRVMLIKLGYTSDSVWH